MRPVGAWCLALVVLLFWLAIAVPRTEARRVSCDRVLSTANREVRLSKGGTADLSAIARGLGTTVAWVEHCMLAYGRRPRRPGYQTAESRETELERLESDEPEEEFPEDVEEPGARERVVHPQRPRVLRVKPPPTPKEFEEFRYGYED